jgi:hypothetical protein
MFNFITQAAPALACVLLGAPPPAEPARIRYEVSSLGDMRWQYTYELANIFLDQPVSEFTIWFDRHTQRSLAIETPDPPAASWSELVVQPDPLLQADGFYDALAIGSGLMPGTSVYGFSVSFDWLGEGLPGAQPFDIVDPVSFQVLYSGITVPEPGSVLLLLTGTAIAARVARRPQVRSDRRSYGSPCCRGKPSSCMNIARRDLRSPCRIGMGTRSDTWF